MKVTDIWPIRPIAHPEATICGGSYRITVLTDRLLRLEYEREGAFCDMATQMALCREFPLPEFTVTDKAGQLIVETKALRLVYDKAPFSATGLSVTLKGSYSYYASIWHYGDPADTLGGTARTLDEADGAIPLGMGLMSAKGYAVLDDSHSMRMDCEGNLLPAQAHGEDMYLFAYGHDYQDCLRDYLTLSGSVPPVPRFALGNWWSRFYPYTQESYQALMERFESEGVPLSVSVLDMNWHVTEIDPRHGTGWTGYTWDREKFPEPEKLLAWLHAHGLAVTLNDHPADGVRACEELYPQMARAMGEDPITEKPFPFDAADERFRRAFEDSILTPQEKTGVDFWWIDWQQQGGSSDPGMDPLFVLNHTRYQHALEIGWPALILSRFGGPGSHRYPVGFSGDTCATWDSLAFQPYFTATAANIAYTWWSHDIGGHMHGVKDDELAARWVQFGVFSPVMRLHSSTSRFMRKEPWHYPAETQAVMKKYLRLRHQLVPWLYTQNLLSSRNRTALLRPMYYDYPQEQLLYHACRHQYLLGEGMIVSPVTKPADAVSKLAGTEVWLPEGLWTDFFTGLRYQGGRMLTMYRPLENMPVLVRAGTIIPMDGAEIPGNGVSLPETVLLRVFIGADCEAELIEDNGRLPADPAYRQAVTRIRLCMREGMTVEILPVVGDEALLPARRRYIIELNGFANAAPRESSCPFELCYDEDRRALLLTLETDAVHGALIHWTDEPAMPAPDWLLRLDALLMPAEIPFDQKDNVMSMARHARDSISFLAQLHMLSLPESLYGAILELLSAC